MKLKFNIGIVATVIILFLSCNQDIKPEILVNTEWKILGMTSAPGYSTPKSTPNIFIHNDVKK
jgi:hypothetical protein